tara:strand:- start:148 stop:606 length:459 start_codon:yes stop_codon:yes gene_type:complete
MLENAIYSVISPEGCATILWRDPKKTLEAAEAMKLTSKQLYELKIIDEIIQEPTGGAHRDRDKILENVRNSIQKNLEYFYNLSDNEIIQQRKNKFLNIGRSRGFSTKPDIGDSLTLKKSNIINLIETILKQKKILLGSVLSIGLLIGLIYLL